MNTSIRPIARTAPIAILAALCLAPLVGCEKIPGPRENTMFPSGFSKDDFLAVREGEKWEDVLARLGDPFSYMDIRGGGKRYFYSKPKDESLSYAAYDVGVDAEGRVWDTSIIHLVLD